MTRISNCPLCGSGNLEQFYNGIDKYFSNKVVNFMICDVCSLVFLNPRPSKQEYDNLYKNIFQDKRRGLNNFEDAVNRLQRKKSYDRKIKELKYFKGYIDENSSCLEIGAGWGTLAKVIKENIGCDIKGIEPSLLAAQIARDYYDLDVYTGDFDSFYLNSPRQKEYDFIFSYHVIEHILDQNDFLHKVRGLLKDNAKLLLALPNIINPDYPYEKFFHLEHCYYYSPNTIRLMLEKNGLEVAELWQCDKDIKVMCKKAGLSKNHNFSNQECKKFKSALKRFNRRYQVLRFIRNMVLFPFNDRYRYKISKLASSFCKKIRLIKN